MTTEIVVSDASSILAASTILLADARSVPQTADRVVLGAYRFRRDSEGRAREIGKRLPLNSANQKRQRTIVVAADGCVSSCGRVARAWEQKAGKKPIADDNA